MGNRTWTPSASRTQRSMVSEGLRSETRANSQAVRPDGQVPVVASATHRDRMVRPAVREANQRGHLVLVCSLPPPIHSPTMDLVKRALGIIPLLILISFLAFLLMRAAPGGPFDKERKAASPDI